MKNLIAGVVMLGVVAGVVFGAKSLLKTNKPAAPNYGGGAAGGDKALTTLPYLSFTEDTSDRMGVTLHDKEATADGLNIYVSWPRKTAYLMRMDGTIAHSWSDGENELRNARVRENGDLFAIIHDKALQKMDWNSKVLWRTDVRAHHDLDFVDDGDLYVLTRKTVTVERDDVEYRILDDYVTRMSPDGEVKSLLSMYELFGDRISERRWKLVRHHGTPEAPRARNKVEHEKPWDVIHTNRLRILRQDIPGIAKKGQLLISLRELDTIAIVDDETDSVVWTFTHDSLQRQHYPTLMPNGNIILFNNGVFRRTSEVLEIDPIKGEIVWRFRGTPPKLFFSEYRGSAQRLPSGNTLIAESDKGRAFVIDKEGKLVWDYYMAKKDKRRRETLYRIVRLDPELEAAIRKLL